MVFRIRSCASWRPNPTGAGSEFTGTLRAKKLWTSYEMQPISIRKCLHPEAIFGSCHGRVALDVGDELFCRPSSNNRDGEAAAPADGYAPQSASTRVLIELRNAGPLKRNTAHCVLSNPGVASATQRNPIVPERSILGAINRYLPCSSSR
jgi:hypothetical protein